MCLRLKMCCCCIDLEVGAQLISILSVMISGLIMLLYGSILALATLPYTKMVFYAAVTAVSGCQFVFGCFLTHGTFTKKPSFMWPWIILSWCMGVALMGLSILGIVVLAYHGGFLDNLNVSVMIAVYIAYAVLLFYFTSVVNSRRKEISSDNLVYTIRSNQRTYTSIKLR